MLVLETNAQTFNSQNFPAQQPQHLIASSILRMETGFTISLPPSLRYNPKPSSSPLCFYRKDPPRVTWSHGFWSSVEPSEEINAPGGQGCKDRERC